jgi:GMP synthase (glutamine-hydrolysing)
MEKILIIDFGSQYTQLIARRVRELQVYCEIVPFNKIPDIEINVKGIIFSGSPFSVSNENALHPNMDKLIGAIPILGICYGAQYIAQHWGGVVQPSSKREYGKAILKQLNSEEPLFEDVPDNDQVWMSHGDTILEISEQFEVIASTDSIEIAAFKSRPAFFDTPIYCLQFHPEVTHSLHGKKIIQNFVLEICNCSPDWTPDSFIESSIESLKISIGTQNVIMGLSGGVDSTVAAVLLDKAIDNQLFCVFVDNGLLRKDEYQQVLEDYQNIGLNVIGIDAKDQFYAALSQLTDPEDKRKAIGKTFIDVFEKTAQDLENDYGRMIWLGQGTIYPDVIESISVHGPSVTIKSHHNVGGLPDQLNLKIIEPLRLLFKDEVREVGKYLQIPDHILNRHPFPGPGLGIRILGEITEEKVRIVQEADAIFIKHLKKSGWYQKVWQAGAILLPVQSVGVMGDERTYERAVVLRAVNSVDGMTAEWSPLPYDLLGDISSEIINHVKGINRVVYDISTKPPSTIEWE